MVFMIIIPFLDRQKWWNLFFCSLESLVFNLAGTLSTAMLSMRTKPSKGPGELGELLYSLYGVFMEHKTTLWLFNIAMENPL